MRDGTNGARDLEPTQGLPVTRLTPHRNRNENQNTPPARTRGKQCPATSATPQEHARHDNHVRYMILLARQLDYLRSAGFRGIDVDWQHLDHVIYGGCRPG